MVMLTDVVFIQMSAKEGIKIFLEQVGASMFKGFKQLDYVAMSVKPVLGYYQPRRPQTQKINERLNQSI